MVSCSFRAEDLGFVKAIWAVIVEVKVLRCVLVRLLKRAEIQTVFSFFACWRKWIPVPSEEMRAPKRIMARGATALLKPPSSSSRHARFLCTMFVLIATGGISVAIINSAAAASGAVDNQKSATPAAATPDNSQVAAGRYLVRAGDCRACHSRPGGPPFAGGLPLKTPFGTVFTANITPDRATGIGKWSDEEFYHAMHDGHGPQGELYYPAFPYTFFTKVTKKDVMAIKAYLTTLKPVHYKKPANKLEWPFDYRFLLYVWQGLFFHAGAFHPNPNRSALYNRGAYLVQGLGHCGACHSPRNSMGAIEASQALTGAYIDGWYAPNISTDKKSTIRDMNVANLATFLRTGAAKPRQSGFGPQTAALGPMAQVVHQSLSHLREQDLLAIATYLKYRGLTTSGKPGAQEAAKSKLGQGQAIFAANCSMCHGKSGTGLAPYVPALNGNPIINLKDPLNVVNTILRGAPQTPAQRFSPNATMPAFGSVLNNKEIAAVASYIRTHWRNHASPVTVAQVKALRH